MQIFEVALSRRICCSLVCNANLKAGLPWVSIDCPTSRPGSDLSNPLFTAINPACGPPKPTGTPNLCAEPTAISAPYSPGDLKSVNASRSQLTIANAFCFWISLTIFVKSLTRPLLSGYATIAAKISAGIKSFPRSISTILIFRGFALVLITALTCECKFASITNADSSLPCQTLRARVIASAAAVASSSIDAFAIASPVRSVIAV